MKRKLSIIYERQGLGGLFFGTIGYLKNSSIPFIYSHDLMSRLHHPKLEIAFLELTNKCNLRCKMCKWQSREKIGFMSDELFRSCIKQMADIRLSVLNLQFGGESLLHPNFERFVKFAVSERDDGKIGSVGLTDNGMLFNESVADLFVSQKLDWVNFSLDGIGEVNDRIRLGSKYSTIEKNIKYLLERRGNSKKPAILLNMVDYAKTEEEKLSFYQEWVPFVDSIELIPAILPNNSWENKNYRMAPPPEFCNSPFNTIIISWDGKVTGCCFDSKFDMDLGDVIKEPIKQVWTGPKFRALRKAVITNIFPQNSPCHSCDFWKINFEPGCELILNGKARIEYSDKIRKIRGV
jgi:radical SAM protein with 4Fe4S-binding SPASM domain